jgi:hypothetical protein
MQVQTPKKRQAIKGSTPDKPVSRKYMKKDELAFMICDWR